MKLSIILPKSLPKSFLSGQKKTTGMETEQTPSADEDHAPGKLQDGTCGKIVLSPSKNSIE